MAGKSKMRSLRMPKLNLKVVVAALAAAGSIFVAWSAFASPQRVAAAAASTSATLAADALASTSQHVADIKVGKKTSAAALLTQAQALDVLLPAEANKIDLVTKIPKLAGVRHVSITRMDPVAVAVAGATPGQPPATGSKATGVSAQAFSMAATGSIADLTAWLTDLATFPALVGTSDVVLNLTPPLPPGSATTPPTQPAGGTATAGSDTVTFTLRAFYVPVAPIAAH